jgi:hypothetical protein
MRLMMFLKLIILALCASLIAFAFLPDSTVMGTAKIMAVGTVLSIGVTAFYPEIRGIKAGDAVSVVADSGIPAIIGRMGTASAGGKKNERIKIMLQNGTEVVGVIESYTGLISPPRIRLIYEERLVD